MNSVLLILLLSISSDLIVQKIKIRCKSYHDTPYYNKILLLNNFEHYVTLILLRKEFSFQKLEEVKELHKKHNKKFIYIDFLFKILTSNAYKELFFENENFIYELMLLFNSNDSIHLKRSNFDQGYFEMFDHISNYESVSREYVENLHCYNIIQHAVNIILRVNVSRRDDDEIPNYIQYQQCKDKIFISKETKNILHEKYKVREKNFLEFEKAEALYFGEYEMIKYEILKKIVHILWFEILLLSRQTLEILLYVDIDIVNIQLYFLYQAFIDFCDKRSLHTSNQFFIHYCIEIIENAKKYIEKQYKISSKPQNLNSSRNRVIYGLIIFPDIDLQTCLFKFTSTFAIYLNENLEQDSHIIQYFKDSHRMIISYLKKNLHEQLYENFRIKKEYNKHRDEKTILALSESFKFKENKNNEHFDIDRAKKVIIKKIEGVFCNTLY